MNEKNASKRLPHIVIIGCGFGGLEAAKAFKRQPVRVTLIDRSNHHPFQPLLYQVATAGLAAPLISAPIGHVFRQQANLTCLMGEVTQIDAAKRTVSWIQVQADAEAESAHGSTAQSMAFDHLIVATGATHSYFGHDDWAAHAPGLKTLADAMALRRSILLAFEAAESEPDEAARQALMRFVVIGAGPTGVEMAGTLAEIARHTLPGEFRRIDPAQAQVILLEGGPRVLQAMPEGLSQRALEQLRKLGVQVRLNAKVVRVDAQGVAVQAPDSPEVQTKSASSPHETSAECYEIKSKTVIWAAGVAASPLGRVLQSATGCELDRAGRVRVQPDLSVAGAPEISVIGDLAAALSHHKGTTTPVPGVSPAAKQMGRTAAANILRRIRGQSTLAFRYRDYGNLATIGRNAAVVDLATPLGPLRFSGKLAWLFWLFAHVYFLIGFRNRFLVLIDWAHAYLSFSRSARVVVESAEAAKPSA